MSMTLECTPRQHGLLMHHVSLEAALLRRAYHRYVQQWGRGGGSTLSFKVADTMMVWRPPFSFLPQCCVRRVMSSSKWYSSSWSTCRNSTHRHLYTPLHPLGLLLLGTEAAVMTPNGVNFSSLFFSFFHNMVISKYRDAFRVRTLHHWHD